MSLNINVNSNNTNITHFNNTYNTHKIGSSITPNTQNTIFKNSNTSQGNTFPFKSNSTQKAKQTNLQSYGFGSKPSQNTIFNRNITPSATNIMGTVFNKTQDTKINQGSISWSELRLKGAIKPPNIKITQALVKCVAAQPSLIQYSIIQIRCKVYFQKMQFEQSNLIYNLQSQQNNGGFMQNNNIFGRPNPLAQIQTQNQTLTQNQIQTQNNIDTYKMMPGFQNRVIAKEIVFTQIRNFLDSLGITSDVLEFLMRMGLSQQQIKQFISRRMLLRNLEQQRLNRFVLPMQNPTQIPQKTYPNNQYVQNGGFFNQISPKNPQNLYDRYVDYALYKDQFTLQSQILEEAQQKYLKSDLVQYQQKQKAVTKLLDELETIGMSRKVEMQRDERIRRINMLYKGGHASQRQQQKNIRVSKIEENSFSQNRSIPLEQKRFYIP